MWSQRFWLYLSIFLVLFSYWFTGNTNREVLAQPKESIASNSQDSVRQQADLLGAQTCTNAACHGSLKADETSPELIRFDEYHVWTSDPHQHAYQTLFNARSKNILQNLGVLNAVGETPNDKQLEYEKQWRNCLGCHNTGGTSESTPLGVHLLGEGVSCEACHGAASGWLDRHYRSDWKKLTAAEKSQYGYRNLDQLSTQASTCANCHVGYEKGEVNHDLIAAGHPAMKFDFSWYRERMPRHWKEERHSSSATISQESVWLIGQATSQLAALKQLQLRANSDKTWPELSEYACYSCHHDLQGAAAWQPERGFTLSPNSSAGLAKVLIPWSAWEHHLLPFVATELQSKTAQEYVNQFNKLDQLMNSSISPGAEEVAEKAGIVVESLQRLIAELEKIPSEQLHVILSDIVKKSDATWPVHSWERSTHLFFALAAPYRRNSELDIPQTLIELRELLQFPVEENAMFDSPKQFQGQVGTGPNNSVDGEPSQRDRINTAIHKLFSK